MGIICPRLTLPFHFAASDRPHPVLMGPAWMWPPLAQTSPARHRCFLNTQFRTQEEDTFASFVMRLFVFKLSVAAPSATVHLCPRSNHGYQRLTNVSDKKCLVINQWVRFVALLLQPAVIICCVCFSRTTSDWLLPPYTMLKLSMLSCAEGNRETLTGYSKTLYEAFREELAWFWQLLGWHGAMTEKFTTSAGAISLTVAEKALCNLRVAKPGFPPL